MDLFVGRYVKFDPEYRSYYAADNYPGPLDYEPETNLLFHNNCNGDFTDVSAKHPASPNSRAAPWESRRPISTSTATPISTSPTTRRENFLFHNEKNGTFEEIALAAGVAYGQNGESTSAMGPVFADFDGDGRSDLWVSDSQVQPPDENTGEAAVRGRDASTQVSPSWPPST